MFRHQFEVNEELEALQVLKEWAEVGGNDERVYCIEAQITTIKDKLNRQEVEEMYGDDQPIMEAAITAYRWMYEDDEAPSRGWAHEEIERAAA